jgi:hypothetical protein
MWDLYISEPYRHSQPVTVIALLLLYSITLSLGVINVMLRAFGNFRRALVPYTFLDPDADAWYRSLSMREVKPEYGTNVTVFP